MNKKNEHNKTHFEELMEKDRWHADELGLRFSPEGSHYWLQFGNINPHWLKEVVKQLIYNQALTKTYATCRNYLRALVSFSQFITNVNANIKPEEINRKLMVDYIHELCAVKNLSPSTIQSYLSKINCFFEKNLQEKWLALSKERLIFSEDFPPSTTPLPKFIPESVIQQLLANLTSLPKSDQHLIILLLETGRRCGEIFSLPYHCLQQDNVGDYFMKVKDRKMKQSLLIPISENCVQHVKLQQNSADKITSSKDSLFVIKKKNGVYQLKSKIVIRRLNALAKKKNIVDDNGCIWHFHFHQFRHTAATRMINHGVPQHIVQRYLGHLSPEMTARYASIYNVTLKEEFNKFQKRLSKSKEEIIIEKALTDPDALTDYQQQLEDITKCIEMSIIKGWKGSLNRNIAAKEKLEKIINTIQQGHNNAKSKT